MRVLRGGAMKSSGHPERAEERGQILVLFGLMLTMLALLAALLYSSASELVLRRQLQNAGDAAALAAANLMEQGSSQCNATRIASSGAGNDLYTAAKNSLSTNLGWTAAQVTSRMTITCPSGYSNVAVRVELQQSGPTWFGASAQNVATSSTGMNGQYNGGDYSVALLDPSNLNWTGHGGRTGCASYLVNGGVTVTYEGSVFVDSTCTLNDSTSGSVKAQNSAFSMTMLNSARLITSGQVSSGTVSKITPAPTENFRPLYADPLAGLIKPCHATSSSSCLGDTSTLPAKDTATNGSGQCKNTKVACVLSPGTYSGGILAANGSNASTLLLRPGVYYIEGGGLQLKSGAAQIVAIPALTGTCGGSGTCSNANAITRYCNPTNNNNGSCQLTTDQVGTNFATDCPTPPAASTCGVLIYNAMADTNTAWVTTGNSDAIQNGSQGLILLRAYNPTYDTIAANGSTNGGTTFASYKNVVVWQARTAAPSASAAQPVIGMQGGACVIISGTFYAPGAEIDFGGSTCGTGGGQDAQLKLQFVCWDLTLAGNNNFYFSYTRAAFAQPFAYGLVQ
jgi:Putative Flp pilus-assembly TadE/G-like